MILTVNDVTFTYPNNPVLQEVNFTLERGQLLAVMGTNGSGKSTLLKCINRILKPQTGIVKIDSDPISSLSRNEVAQRIGYVEQQRSGSRMTVFNAVLLGRKPYVQWDISQEDMAIAARAIEVLGLSDLSLRYLDELSGGELQKVIIARALTQEPEIFLMDEPTSSLDMKNQLEVLVLIHQITHKQGIAAVVAIHDLNLALHFADKFILLKDKKIFAAGGAEILTPENIESVYSVPVEIASHKGKHVVIPMY